MKEGKATPDWDYLHMLTYCWKLFRYCSDGWIPVETKIVKRIHWQESYFSLFYCFSTYYSWLLPKPLVCPQTSLSWSPREHPFTHGRTAKISEKFPSAQGSINRDQQWRWHISATILVTTCWANLEMSYLQSQTNLCPLQSALRFSISVVPLHSGVHHPTLCPDFHAGFSYQSWNMNN